MVILIAGGTHTGKTLLAQRLMERHHFPYLSLDHLKMGLIRSGRTDLTPDSATEELTAYLWPIVREMIKTAIENKQNLIVEGCYLPFDYREDFEGEYLEQIRFVCLIFSQRYISNHLDAILRYEGIIETRDSDDKAYVARVIREESATNLQMCRQHGCDYILIDEEYNVDFRL